jgi:hypothetical protein
MGGIMKFIDPLNIMHLNGGKKSGPSNNVKPAASPMAAPVDRNITGAALGAGRESSNVLSNGNVARSTFLGG